MKSLWLVLSGMSLSAFAAPAALREYRLSDSSTLTWNAPVEMAPTFTPELGFRIFTVRAPGGKADAQVRRVPAPVLANPISAEQMWKENLAQLPKDEKVEDLGCKRPRSSIFECTRNGRTPSGSFVQDRMIFNGKHDVIVLHLSTPVSKQFLDSVSKQLGVRAQ